MKKRLATSMVAVSLIAHPAFCQNSQGILNILGMVAKAQSPKPTTNTQIQTPYLAQDKTIVSSKTIEQYYAEQSQNGMMFDKKYKGRYISIEGYVDASGDDGNGVAFISIGGKPDKYGFPSSYSAMCHLYEEGRAQNFISLNKNAHIIMTGHLLNGLGLKLNDCSYRLIKAK